MIKSKNGFNVKIETIVGMRSLVGVRYPKDKQPLNFGNYFYFSNRYSKEEIFNGCRCLNMWAENVEYLRREKKILELDVIIYHVDDLESADLILVCDNRLSKDWILEKICWTGYNGRIENIELSKEIRDTCTRIYNSLKDGSEVG